MHLSRQILFLFVMLLPIYTWGQGKYTLNGHLHVKGADTYPYRLVVDVSKNSVSGFSYTKMPDGSENKSIVKGHINRKKQILAITETRPVTESQKDMTLCMVDAKLIYKLNGANFVAIGTFTGKDDSGKYCGDGILEFQQANTQSSLFYTEPEAKSPAVSADSPAKPEHPLGENTITAGVQKTYDWNSDSCIVDIWDAGVIDGDIVSVLLNGQPVLSGYTLAKEKKQIRLRLASKTNTITIVAEDEGINPPNTAEMILSDGDIRYKITAFNKKGEKAVVIIKKK